MQKRPGLNNSFLSRNTYIFLFSLLGLIYFIGLFVPLIDNDSAHHAAIALQMHLTGDYANLVDWGGDYLDKPHLLFWLSAFSYKIFGVTSFAFKFPSFLFTLLGIYSTFRLGKILYNKEVGRLAALLLASGFAFIVAVTDVRMDAILTATIAFATWQLIAFVQHRRFINVLLSSLGLALAFSTKGHIGVFVPVVGTFFYILYRKEYSLFLNWRWLCLIFFFFLFISPVIYAYYLQYNLHPEKVVRGKNHINGIKFILFNQSIERFTGGMGGDAKNDYLFSLHSFLWAFAPWSIITFIALAGYLKNFFRRSEEWATVATFVVVLLIVSFSSFKLPHYLNVIFPVSAIMTAATIVKKSFDKKWISSIFTLQFVVSSIILLIAAFINGWAFPVRNPWVIIGTILFLALFFYFAISKSYSPVQKLVAVPVSAMILLFFLLNANFFPGLLKYQAGQQLENITRGKVDPNDVYIQKGGYSYSSSYTYYSKSVFKTFDDSLLSTGRKIWLLTEPPQLEKLKEDGYRVGTVYSAIHFRVTKLSFKFMNPSTREKECSRMMIVEILSKN